MENPWKRIPERPPYLLDKDESAIRAFNASASEDYRIREELFPEPYLGQLDAEIVLLNGNPGFSEEDEPFQARPDVQAAWRKNLLQEPLDYPFYLLNPNFPEVDGHRWWTRKLKTPIQLWGLNKVSRGICCIEFFPYHSRKFRGIGEILDSQRYSFSLVEQAMARKSVIVLMRCESEWLHAVPGLRGYRRYFKLNSQQNVAISKRNCPRGFPAIQKILEAGE